MQNSNWSGPFREEAGDSNRSNQYRVDNVGLQIGLDPAVPLQVIPPGFMGSERLTSGECLGLCLFV